MAENDKISNIESKVKDSAEESAISNELQTPVVSREAFEESKKRRATSPLEHYSGVIDTAKLIDGINESFDVKLKLYCDYTKKELERQTQSLINRFETRMETKFKEVRDSFVLDIGKVVADYERERAARQVLETQTSEMKVQMDKMDDKMTELQTTVTAATAAAVEATVAVQNVQSPDDQESRRILIKGLHYGDGTQPEALITHIHGIMEAMQVQVDVSKVERIVKRRTSGAQDGT